MQISAPLISVVIPAYNYELYISEIVESVLQQQDCDYEIVIIDDPQHERSLRALSAQNSLYSPTKPRSCCKLLDVRPWENVPKLDLEDWLRWKPVLPSAMMFRRDIKSG